MNEENLKAYFELGLKLKDGKDIHISRRCRKGKDFIGGNFGGSFGGSIDDTDEGNELLERICAKEE